MTRIDRENIRKLMSRIYVKDGLLFWQAVEALGKASASLEKEKQGYAAELVRRYFWSLNEESGGTAWNASEAIGSIMYHNPKECGHFNWMYANLLEDESLQEGVLWGLFNLAINAPEVVDPLADAVRPFLNAQAVNLRGLALWIFVIMKNSPTPGDWEVPVEIVNKMAQDSAEIEVYIDGELYKYQIIDILDKEVLTFCFREFKQGDFTWKITLVRSQKGLCWVGLGKPEEEEQEIRAWAKKKAPKALIIPRAIPNQAAIDQLAEYFTGKRQAFTIPLDNRGTPFQQRVWEELRRIPYGETRSYGEIAENVGNPKGPRAVGMANNQNPIAIITPCHRVVGKKGDLVGYASGLEHKQRLLRLESEYRGN